MAEFAVSKDLSSSYEETLAELPKALGAEGFGVLTEVDVTGVLAKKLGQSFRKYRILGACNPVLAHRALSSNLLAGVMMPCNVIVWERDDGQATVAAVNPLQAAPAAADPAIAELAREVRSRLDRVFEKLS